MNIIEISPKEYKVIFDNPYHVFNSVDFNELNKYKCDSVHYLIFHDGKIRMGLIIGKKSNSLLSPFSAPFGCFSFLDQHINIKKIDEALQLLDDYSKREKICSIKFILPPLFYSVSFLSQLINALNRNNYTLSYIDLNHIFSTSFFNEKYTTIIHRNARKNLNIALMQNLVFSKTDNMDLTYSIIAKNRAFRGIPLKMTLEQVKETNRIVKHDAFIVRFKNDYIASALIYHVANKIVQVIYWGDIPEFSSMKTMNFLSYKIFEYYNNSGIEIIDIGPSSEFGLPNYSLCEFKESIGCSVESKFTFEKKILNIEFVEYSRDFLEKSHEWLNDKEIKELTMTPDFTVEQQELFFNSLSIRSNYFIKGIKYNDLLIGACGLKNITELDGEYWGYIGEKKFWGQGIGKEMLKFIIEVSNEKKLDSIYLRVSPKNERAKNLYIKYGFVVEKINEDHLFMRLRL